MEKISVNLDHYEKIACGKKGDYLVKLSRPNQFDKLLKNPPNCKFLSVSMDKIDLDKLLSDDKNLYVNVIPGTTFDSPLTSARVMVPGSRLDQFYAVEAIIS